MSDDSTLTFFSYNNEMTINIDNGKWKLNGNKLTIINTDKNTSETFTVKIIDKETIMIGDDEFHYYYSPEDPADN